MTSLSGSVEMCAQYRRGIADSSAEKEEEHVPSIPDPFHFFVPRCILLESIHIVSHFKRNYVSVHKVVVPRRVGSTGPCRSASTTRELGISAIRRQWVHSVSVDNEWKRFPYALPLPHRRGEIANHVVGEREWVSDACCEGILQRLHCSWVSPTAMRPHGQDISFSCRCILR